MTIISSFRLRSPRKEDPKQARDPVMIGAALLCGLLVLFGIVGPILSSHSPDATDILNARQGPSPAHWFGTDPLGRDIFVRVAAGARLSLVIPLLIVLLAATVAIALSLISAWFGGWIDAGISRVLDVLFAFPSLLFAIIAVAVFGSGATAPIIALAIAYIPYLARLARVEARRTRQSPYIAAGQLLGLSPSRLILRHMLPALWPVTRTQAAIMYGGALTDFAAISFLGLGVQPPTPEWGAMVSAGRTSLLDGHPEEALFAGLLIVVTVAAFNLLAERLAKREEHGR